MKNLSIATTPTEFRWGWRYLCFEMVFLPIFISLAAVFLRIRLSDAMHNLIFFCINFVAVTFIFRNFLLESLRAAGKNLSRFLIVASMGFAAYWVLNFALSWLIVAMDPGFANVNDGAVGNMLDEAYLPMAVSTVLLVPVAEECLFRALFFQGLHAKSRLAAYIVSTLAFCAVHVTGYIGYCDALTLLLCFLQYVPAGLCLAWAYEKADTIIAPITIHAAINAVGIFVLR